MRRNNGMRGDLIDPFYEPAIATGRLPSDLSDPGVHE